MSIEITAVSAASASVSSTGYRAATLVQTGAPTPTTAGDVKPVTPDSDFTQTSLGSRESIEHALQELARKMKGSDTDLQFRLDRDSGRMIVSVIDARDGTVLRQLPTEVALRIARGIESLREHLHLVEEVA